MIFTLSYCYGVQTENDEKIGACGTFGKELPVGFVRKTRRDRVKYWR